MYRNCLRCGAATDVEEVRGIAAIQLDDVHGGHGQTSTIHHATNIAYENEKK